MSDTREVAVQFIRANKDESNGLIARKLIQQYPSLFQSMQVDSLRRWVSFIRRDEHIESSVVHGRNAWMIQNAGKPSDRPTDDPQMAASAGDAFSPDSPAQVISKTTNAQDYILRGFEGEPPSLEDFLREWKVDLEVWRVDRYEVNTYHSHTKLRHYDLTQKGKSGFFRKDDEHRTVPLWQVKAKLVRKIEYVESKEAVEGLLEILKANPLTYVPIKRPLLTTRPLLLEVDAFDLHYGKLVWGEESGHDYDIKIAEELLMTAVEKLLQQSQKWHGQVERIVFPVGNDFFNVDSKFNTTTAGTPQQEDTRWPKTLQRGTALMIKVIERLRQVAPVDLVVISGNHDEQRALQLGITLQYAFGAFKDVTINNSPRARKYVEYGQCMIGFAHGRDIKPARLMQMMATDEQEMWARTIYREWHLGDIHHKKEVELVGTEEHAGMTVRYLRSLTSTDAWHDAHGFAHNVRAIEGFLWDKEDGLVAQFAANLGIS